MPTIAVNIYSEPVGLLSDQPDLVREAGTICVDPDIWLGQPNDQLGGRSPRELIDSGDIAQKNQVRDLIRSIQHGHFT
jgi:hypothetical protein